MNETLINCIASSLDIFPGSSENWADKEKSNERRNRRFKWTEREIERALHREKERNALLRGGLLAAWVRYDFLERKSGKSSGTENRSANKEHSGLECLRWWRGRGSSRTDESGKHGFRSIVIEEKLAFYRSLFAAKCSLVDEFFFECVLYAHLRYNICQGNDKRKEIRKAVDWNSSIRG